MSPRWLALLPFAGAGGVMVAHDPALAAPTLASLAAAALLIARLAGPPVRTLWAWVLLALFAIGYQVQAALAISLAGDSQALATSIGRDMTWVTRAVVAEAYVWIAGAFVAAAVTAAIALTMLAREAPARPTLLHALDARRLAWLLAAIGAASLVLATLRAGLDIGVLGRETQHLPLRIDTAIFRGQSHVLPALLLYALWVAEQARRSRFAIAAAALFVGHQLLVGVLSTSKAWLLWFAVPVFFLWMCDGRLTRRRGVLIGAVLAVVVVSYPFVTALRYARVVAGVESPADVGRAMAAHLSTQTPAAMARETARRLLHRVNGAAGVWFTLRAVHVHGGLDQLWPDRAVPLVRYYTRDVYGVTDPGDFRQPGLVAAFLIAGGSRGWAWLWVIFVGSVAAAWWGAGRLRTAPVARALTAFYLLTFANEGTLQWQDIVAGAFCLLAVEGVHRWVTSPSGRSPAASATAPEVP